MVIVYILAGLAIRLTQYDDPLWYDEIFTATISKLPFNRMMAAIVGDVHPPLSYIFTWIAMHLFGDFGARLPAVIFSIIGLDLTRRVLAALVPERIGWPALIAVNLSPFMIYYGVEARAYSLLYVLVLAATLAVIEKRWGWFVVCGAAAFWTHNAAMIYIPLLLGWTCYKNGVNRAVWCSIGIVGLACPWWPILLYQIVGLNSGDYWIPESTITRVVGVIHGLLVGYRPDSATWWLYVIAYTAIMPVGIWAHRRGGLVIIMAFYPLLLAVIFSFLVSPIIISRILIASIPFLMVILAEGVSRLNMRLAWALAALFMVVGAAFIVRSPVRPDYVAYYAKFNIKPDSTCVFTTPGNYVIGTYYLKNCAHSYTPIEIENRVSQSLSEETKDAIGMTRARFDDLSGRVYIVHHNLSKGDPDTDIYVYRILRRYPVVNAELLVSPTIQVWNRDYVYEFIR